MKYWVLMGLAWLFAIAGPCGREEEDSAAQSELRGAVPLTQLLADAGRPYDGATVTVSGFLDGATKNLYLTREYAEAHDWFAVLTLSVPTDEISPRCLDHYVEVTGIYIYGGKSLASSSMAVFSIAPPGSLAGSPDTSMPRVCYASTGSTK